MRKRFKTEAEQLDLFVPLPQRPTWTQLPQAVKDRLTNLLAELLREKHGQKASPTNAKEAADE